MVAARLAVVQAGPDARLRNLLLLAGLIVWMVYTRFFWPLYSVHATLPTCPFLLVTGHPCPFCGGTRSFAYLWNGDVRHAVALYPLGPLLFGATLAAIPTLALAVVAGRDLAVSVPRPWQRPLWVAGGGVLAASWALKLTILPN